MDLKRIGDYTPADMRTVADLLDGMVGVVCQTAATMLRETASCMERESALLRRDISADPKDGDRVQLPSGGCVVWHYGIDAKNDDKREWVAYCKQDGAILIPRSEPDETS